MSNQPGKFNGNDTAVNKRVGNANLLSLIATTLLVCVAVTPVSSYADNLTQGGVAETVAPETRNETLSSGPANSNEATNQTAGNLDQGAGNSNQPQTSTSESQPTQVQPLSVPDNKIEVDTKVEMQQPVEDEGFGILGYIGIPFLIILISSFTFNVIMKSKIRSQYKSISNSNFFETKKHFYNGTGSTWAVLIFFKFLESIFSSTIYQAFVIDRGNRLLIVKKYFSEKRIPFSDIVSINEWLTKEQGINRDGHYSTNHVHTLNISTRQGVFVADFSDASQCDQFKSLLADAIS